MERKIIKTVSFLVFALLLIALTASHAFPEDTIVSSGPQPLSVSHIWTAEEMAAAKPMPLPVLSGPQPPSAAIGPTGEPGLVPGRPPADDVTTPLLEEKEVHLDEVDPLGYSYPFPFTRHEIFPSVSPLYKFFPYITIGKLYFRRGGSSYYCTACSIGNAGVWTAGHCVSDGQGTWSTDLVFVPATRDGKKSLGQWQWYTTFAWNSWHTSKNYAKDYGGVVVQDILYKGTTYRVSNVTGWLGFAWNWSREQHWHVIGYPGESPFTGGRQIICAASHAVDDIGTPPTMGIGCDQTGGCSGGPWIMDFSGSAGATNFVNGNVSYGYVGEELALYGPYFNDDAKTLWDAVTGTNPP